MEKETSRARLQGFVGRLNRDKRSSIAHALMHLESNHIADDDDEGLPGWYCGNRDQFVNRHKKAIALLQSFLAPNAKISGGIPYAEADC